MVQAVTVSEVRLIPAGTLRVGERPHSEPHTAGSPWGIVCRVLGGDCGMVNQHLAAGWIIIEVVIHRGHNNQATGVAVLVGKPEGAKDVALDAAAELRSGDGG